MLKININRKDNKINAEVKEEVEIKGLVYLDHIIEISEMTMFKDDTISISWDLRILGYSNSRKTSEIKEKFEFEKKIIKFEKIKYIRLTKNEEKGIIKTYYKIPNLIKI